MRTAPPDQPPRESHFLIPWRSVRVHCEDDGAYYRQHAIDRADEPCAVRCLVPLLWVRHVLDIPLTQKPVADAHPLVKGWGDSVVCYMMSKCTSIGRATAGAALTGSRSGSEWPAPLKRWSQMLILERTPGTLREQWMVSGMQTGGIRAAGARDRQKQSP
jgi:hypothetical protein